MGDDITQGGIAAKTPIGPDRPADDIATTAAVLSAADDARDTRRDLLASGGRWGFFLSNGRSGRNGTRALPGSGSPKDAPGAQGRPTFTGRGRESLTSGHWTATRRMGARSGPCTLVEEPLTQLGRKNPHATLPRTVPFPAGSRGRDPGRGPRTTGRRSRRVTRRPRGPAGRNGAEDGADRCTGPSSSSERRRTPGRGASCPTSQVFPQGRARRLTIRSSSTPGDRTRRSNQFDEGMARAEALLKVRPPRASQSRPGGQGGISRDSTAVRLMGCRPDHLTNTPTHRLPARRLVPRPGENLSEANFTTSASARRAPSRRPTRSYLQN